MFVHTFRRKKYTFEYRHFFATPAVSRVFITSNKKDEPIKILYLRAEIALVRRTLERINATMRHFR